MTTSKRINFFIVCRSPTPSTPEVIINSLAQAGYLAELLEVTHWHFTASTMEIALGTSRSRVYVDTSEDFEQGHDLSTGDWEIVEELVEPQEAQSVRRLVVVRAWDHADLAALECLIDSICVQTDGRLSERQTW